MRRLYLINPYNPLVSLVDSKQNRWNRYTVWKPLGLLVIAAMTPKDWEITVFDENVRRDDMSAKNRVVLNRSLGDWRYFTLTFPVARCNHLSWRELIAEKQECYRIFYAGTAIAGRVLNCLIHLRNPVVPLFTNLSCRKNTLHLDRQAYEDFAVSPGEMTMQDMEMGRLA